MPATHLLRRTDLAYFPRFRWSRLLLLTHSSPVLGFEISFVEIIGQSLYFYIFQNLTPLQHCWWKNMCARACAYDVWAIIPPTKLSLRYKLKGLRSTHMHTLTHKWVCILVKYSNLSFFIIPRDGKILRRLFLFSNMVILALIVEPV